MGTHLHAEADWRLSVGVHPPHVHLELTNNLRNMLEPVLHDGVHPYSTQIVVAGAIAEPSRHLQQRVVSLRITVEIADAKAFQREAS